MGLRLASLFALWLALSCANEIKKGRSQNHGHNVCSTWGNNHFKTFDGDFYQFPGLCDYNFASDCQESYQEFSIHIQRAVNENGHPDIQYVLITIKDVVIYLTQNAVVVDKQTVTTPYYSSGLLIENNEIYTKVYARAGLVLMWNREDSLMLELDSKFNNNTCGLCGDYNGQQLYNEFLSKDMTFNPITFGNMQKINKPNTVCEDPDETQTVTTCYQHRHECLSLLTSSAFADCVSRLNLEMYVLACMQDKCACQGAEDSFCLCNTISEYSRQCSHAGGRPGNWRTEVFCPKTCPGNMIYQESSSPCISTCSHLEIGSLCEEHFMDGCFCPEGTVYDDISGKGCVSVNQCHCKQHGSLYSPGQNITNECEECTCDSGRWVCKHLPCPGSCLVEGGAHITTFDGKKYTFHGDCYYVLSKGGINDTHALLAELSPCGSTDTQTCLKTVVLLIDHKKNILVFRSDGTVLLNELEVHLPHVTASFSIFQPTSYHIIVHTYFGLKLQIQLVPIMQLFVIVDQSAQGKLQGLCGNFNGIEFDDFKTAGGLVEATGSAFANTWKAQATCKDQVDNLEDPCALSFESENYAEYWCSLLKNSESAFARCHSVIDPVEYYKRCKYDTCNCKNSEECLCGALSSYARACAFKGIMLGGWRQTVCNKEVSSCPASQVFRYNLTTCQHTCRSLADGEKHCLEGFVPIDGCGCPDNTYMNEKGNCVPISHCTCYYKGSYLEPGDVIVKQEERCVCRNGILHCTQVKIIDDKCLSPKIHFDCSSVKSWSSQTPLQLSCHTLDTDYFQTECVSGCMCPHGLIDDGRGGCVKEKDCPCIHNNHFYGPGKTVKVGCNKCTCQKGRWTCTNNVCYGTCTVYGSGHYISFDGKHYDFDGHCEYVAAQDYCGEDPSGSFSIVTVNVPCGTTGVTCSKAIKIFLGRTELKFEDQRYVEIQRDVGDRIQYRNRTVGLYLVIEASNGMMLIWDKKTTIFIKLTPNYKGKICGLCGNFDDKSNNDFKTRNGLLVTNPLEFGNSWKLSGTCPDVVDEILPCSLKPHRKSWAEKECSIILKEDFKICHNKVDPAPFYENCVHDACSCDSGGDCECFCSAVAAYAQECIKAEACVFWRTPDICPIFCDYYNLRNECKWHYEPCGHQIVSCRIINNVRSNFSLPYLEGCYPRCPEETPIYDEDRELCVTEVDCGCYVNGSRYENGSKIPTKDRCQECICISPKKICTAIPDCRTTTAPPTTTPTVTTTTTPTTTTTTTVPTSTTTTETTTVTSTTSSTSTTPCTPQSQYCWWSDWISVTVPKYGPEYGDYETYDIIRAWNKSAICENPLNISCRALKFPDYPIKDLGQKLTCNVSTGLVCNNRDQVPGGMIPMLMCLDYEISVYCCESVCVTTTTSSTSTTTAWTTSTTKHPTLTPTPTPTTTTTNTTKPSTTATTTRPPSSATTGTTNSTAMAPCTPLSQYCWWSDWISLNKPKYGPEGGDYETYDKIRDWNASAICENPLNISCRAQLFPEIPIKELGQKTTTTTTTTTTESTTTETTTPITTTTESTTTETTTPTTTTPGESYWPCNCTKFICDVNIGWVPVETVCELPPKPTCINGLAPVLVQGECCWHWECDCYCTGWGDPHYVTFDGQYYSYQGNCTYVLVEEINKKIDNFGVYIDNYHCIAQDRVSCPRTLIVKHETQEVRIKTITMFPLKVQVTVNNQEVATPYEKYGVRVFKSGINHVVDIFRLGVNVTYNGLGFSIRLPYQRFGNNTQGQCGTCTNNTADDCMLPDGKIIDNCETMADHWVIKDLEKPHCYPSLITTEAPPVTPPSCKPSDLCKLIKEGLFKACHPFVNPDHYYAACVFDSCALPNAKLECATLQNYAALCADQGVCVDWRGHTRDICPLKCPPHKVYKACGPIEEVTCKSSQVAQNQTSHVEGCFCPAGTMLYGDGVDVCVKTCGCVGPDNKPRKFGEIFEFDCKSCICLEGGNGIICEPLKCPAQEDKPSCSEEGFYEVTEVSPDNICCSITSCRCNASFCTTKPPKCKIGYELVSNIATGKCCPTYKCVPKKVCVLQNAEYMPGSPVFADKCHDCVCTEKSNSSGLNVISCKHIPCNEKCQSGYELQDVKGECCPKCVQTKCIVNKGDSSVLVLSPGKTENDPKDNCTVYSCVSIKGQLISSTSQITCPPFNEDNCKAGTVTLLPNGCCKICIPRESPSPCSVTEIVDHITHKGCRSVDKVYLTQCEGSCGTFSLYSAEANSMEHKCSCCREAETSKKEVLLQCPDGNSVVHKYLHVDRCECLDTECTEPSSSEESKESGEQSAIERVKRAIQKMLK
ncbi:mucin-2-like [Pangshura tecta]